VGDLPLPLSALRAATRGRHDRLDRLMDLRRLGERPRYIRVLQAFDAFLPAWEDAVLAALPPPWHGWLQQRSRRPFLSRDLQALATSPSPCPVAFAPLAGAAAAWGSLYVIEGSALGGQVITRALAAHGLHPEAGAAYFHGWGDATGAMWREFRQLLERELHAPEALAAACDSACHTFDTLTGLMEEALA
jgi:heme oxygenase